MTDLTIGTDPIDLFAFKINYNEAVQSHFPSGSGVAPLYNGNIAETFWRTASDNILRGYGYKYDELNRLKDAYYQKPSASIPLPGNYDEFLMYDLNGNITMLSRFSGTDTPANAQMTDQLDYTYFNNSNQLKKVTDSTNSTTGFNNGNSNTSDDYTYDENGNMITDKNKGITLTPITYNHLNLPTKIQWTSIKKIEYLYNAAGVKVQKKVTNGSNIQTTDYLDGFQYNNNLLEFFPHAEGYVKVTAMGINPNNPQYAYNYVFNYTDHLGNVRVSYTKDPQSGNLKILDEAHYYPFGLKHQKYATMGFMESSNQVVVAPIANNPFKYKYNGKELQDELGLGLYDYGARNYDPALGRWMNIDPKAEIGRPYSPYNYALNNPVYFIDPDGMLAVSSLQEMWDNTTSSSTWVNNGDGTYEGGENEPESDTSENGEPEDCCPNGKGFLKGVANSVIDLAGFGWETNINIITRSLTGNEDFQLLPRFDVEEDEKTGYYAGIILFALVEPSPAGEVNAVIKILIGGGKATKITKAVNSNIAHAIEQGVERKVFGNADEARSALEALTKQVGTNKLPAGTIVDPAHADRILVPIGNNGMAAYQVGSNGTAKIKTVLIAK